MTDAELIKEFIRVDKAPGATQVHVCEIRWEGPATPISEWKLARELPGGVPQSEIDKAIKTVLRDPDYFAICAECKERNPNGWMLGLDDICQSCGEQNHGVVF